VLETLMPAFQGIISATLHSRHQPIQTEGNAVRLSCPASAVLAALQMLYCVLDRPAGQPTCWRI